MRLLTHLILGHVRGRSHGPTLAAQHRGRLRVLERDGRWSMGRRAECSSGLLVWDWTGCGIRALHVSKSGANRNTTNA